MDNFGVKECVKIDVKIHIDFDSDFGAFGARLGSILAGFGSHLGVLGAPRGRQRESQKRPKWGLSARVAPGGFGDPILEDLGASGTLLGSISRLFGRFWGGLGPPSGSQMGSKKDTKRRLGATVAPGPLWDIILVNFGPFGEHFGSLGEASGGQTRSQSFMLGPFFRSGRPA